MTTQIATPTSGLVGMKMRTRWSSAKFSNWTDGWAKILFESDMDAEKIVSRDLWNTLKGYYILTDLSNNTNISEKLYLSSGNILKATFTTNFGENITETLSVVGGITITKVITFKGNLIKETIN